ncbi:MULTISPECIES: hypothetical protein [Bacillota]|uniref:hypothetical protein n=1 Tax=Bacillota TaxID=1239 RepID=UPI0039EFCEA8
MKFKITESAFGEMFVIEIRTELYRYFRNTEFYHLARKVKSLNHETNTITNDLMKALEKGNLHNFLLKISNEEISLFLEQQNKLSPYNVAVWIYFFHKLIGPLNFPVIDRYLVPVEDGIPMIITDLFNFLEKDIEEALFETNLVSYMKLELIKRQPYINGVRPDLLAFDHYIKDYLYIEIKKGYLKDGFGQASRYQKITNKFILLIGIGYPYELLSKRGLSSIGLISYLIIEENLYLIPWSTHLKNPIHYQRKIHQFFSLPDS